MQKTIQKIITASVIMAVMLLGSVSAQDITPKAVRDRLVNAPANPHVVRPIYFYPSDYTLDKRYTRAIDPFMKDVQAWYANQLNGLTFKLLPVKVIRGSRTAAEYGPQPWSIVLAEIGATCGSDVVTLIFFARTLQPSGGRTCSGFWYSGGSYNGDATVSETDLDPEIIATQTGFCPDGFPLGDWRCSPQASRGGIAHELGHAFSLPHPQGCPYNEPYCGQTVMWGWWLWPNTGLLETSWAPEKSTLLGSAWFWNRL